MPQTKAVSKTLAAFIAQYGPKKGKAYFYGKVRKGGFKGVKGFAAENKKLHKKKH
jgi:hypothetical protein